MEARKDFTVDPVLFDGLEELFADLRANHTMKTIIILVSGQQLTETPQSSVPIVNLELFLFCSRSASAQWH